MLKTLPPKVIWNVRTPVKKRHRLAIGKWLKMAWAHVLVFFGLRRWAKSIYPRPRYQPCPYCRRSMKRGAITTTGAYYYCSHDRKRFHLEGGGRKLVKA